MHARIIAAAALLAQSRGSLAGATPEDGMRGLLWMQQAVAMEETLLQDLFFDGAAMGRVRDPGQYDPSA